MLLRNVSRRSIALVPAGLVHRVDNPVDRIDAVLRRRIGNGVQTNEAHVDKLPSTTLSLLALNRYVEAESLLLHAELATQVLSAAAFRHRLEQLRIRGNDESYLTQHSDLTTATPRTDQGTSPRSPRAVIMLRQVLHELVTPQYRQASRAINTAAMTGEPRTRRGR